VEILIASLQHIKYCDVISQNIASSAKVRGTGIALRSPEYIQTKIENNNAIIALENNEFAGFCYIEKWEHGKYVAHSGLIVNPKFRGQGLANKIKKKNVNMSGVHVFTHFGPTLGATIESRINCVIDSIAFAIPFGIKLFCLIYARTGIIFVIDTNGATIHNINTCFVTDIFIPNNCGNCTIA
jgi:hypothetical protein